MITALWLLPISSQAQTLSQTESLIENIERANDLCTSRSSSCLFSSQRPIRNPNRSAIVQEELSPQPQTLAAARTETTIQDIHGRDLKISVIPENQISSLTNLYPLYLGKFDDAVCASRAHVMGDTLAKHGIETVKLMVRPESSWFSQKFIIPDDRFRNRRNTTPTWEFHVANLIYVQKNDGRLVEYVLDPLMEAMPVPRAQWEARLRTNPQSSIGSVDIVSRYVYDNSHVKNKVLEYNQAQLDRSYQTMSASGF